MQVRRELELLKIILSRKKKKKKIVEEIPTESVAGCNRTVGSGHKLHPIGWSQYRSDGGLEKVLKILQFSFLSSNLCSIGSYDRILTFI